MRYEYLILIIGMAVVAYIPRVLPVLFLKNLRITPKVQRFLNLIPYTAMTTMIFPGVVTVDPEKYYIGIVGGAVAIFLSYIKAPVIVTVIVSIGVDLALYTLIP